uniref:Fibrosin n=1 Tax=Oryzias sinensis TaxID=183150 RepID=A0A8C7XLB5_9TELE
MEGPSRSSGSRQSRRSRSQRDRERRRRVDLAEERATSMSSGSDREACGANSVIGPGGRDGRPGFGRHKPPRRRKKESVSCEEDIIDGFAIASFISLEALEMDCSLKPSQRSDMLGRRNKGKRGPEENGGGPLSEPDEGAPHSYSSICCKKSGHKRRKTEVIADPAFSNKSCPPLPARCGVASRLMVTPLVSGLERSQEKSQESHFPESVSSSTSSAPFSCLPSNSATASVTRPSPINGNSSRHNGSPPLSKPKPFGHGGPHSIYNLNNRSSTPIKPPPSALSSSSSMRPPTPSTSVSLPYNRGSGSSGPLRPPSRASSGALFTSSPGLPPPPPLLQGPVYSSAGREKRNEVFHCCYSLLSPFGKWCAMHVYVAWMILNHQKKVKLMQADPHKLDFRGDLLARFPGPGGLGQLGPMGRSLPPTHDLTRPPSLFSATGGVNPSAAPFISQSAPHSSFLPPTAHLDPYGRSPPFTPLGNLGSSAFGGLGSPTLAGSMFGPKDPPPGVVGGLPNSNHHDPWNRLHGGPSGFPGGPSWAKGAEKREERDRAKDGERREIPHIKDEKDRDNMLYGRQPVRMSPVAPSFKPRSSTPVPHINGHSSTLGGSSGLLEDLTRSFNRDRDRERDRDGDKRTVPTMSSRGPLGSSSLVADRDRPRSSSSSVLTTPPPSNRSVPSPLDLYPRPQGQMSHSFNSEPLHSQRDSNLPSSSAPSSSIASLSQGKKSDRTTTPVSKPPLLLPPVKVKEERKEEPEHIPITLPPPAPSHSFERPNSHPHHPRSGTPSSSSLSLTPTPGLPIPPPTPNPPSHQQLVLEHKRAIEAYLGSTAGAAGLVIGPGGERFAPGPSQGPHSYTWDPWREFAPQHQRRREAMALHPDPHLALRTDPHLARFLQHQRIMEAERVAAAVGAPQHPPTSTSNASSAVGPEFGLMAHHFDPQILRHDYERARYFGIHSHLPPGAHLSSPSHAAAAAHLEQLHLGLLTHPLPSGAASQHHASLYSRLGPINPQHMPNGILTKTAAGLVGALSVGAPPPLIPSIANRSSTPPRSSRLGVPGDLALYSTHKDGESR